MHDLRNRLAVVCGSGEGSAFGYAKVESLADIGPLAHCIDGMVETLLTSKLRLDRFHFGVFQFLNHILICRNATDPVNTTSGCNINPERTSFTVKGKRRETEILLGAIISFIAQVSFWTEMGGNLDRPRKRQ